MPLAVSTASQNGPVVSSDHLAVSGEREKKGRTKERNF